MFTIILFVVLIVLYVAMVGLVKFSENIITAQRAAPLGDRTAPRTIEQTTALND